MLRERDRKTAEQFGLTERLEKLKAELLNIDGVEDVEFDLDGFYDNIHQVIVLAKYRIPENQYVHYCQSFREILYGILSVLQSNGLARTGDAIEDYGEHVYIVTSCPWLKKNGKKLKNLSGRCPFFHSGA